MRHRIWQEPGDSTIKVTCYASDDPETIASANRTLIADGHIHPESEYLDTHDIHAILPAQQRFHDDCKLVGGAVLVDRDRAEARVMREVRALRDAALQASDGPMLRAQETGRNVEALRAHRQALRDLPQNTNLTQLSLDALAAYQPVIPVQP